ncbi:MAG: tyrosine--tRNA ligase [Saprospiraceae bacterium]|nr:tyrosine--tRNA ligase [Saprospiraceae bacterium]
MSNFLDELRWRGMLHNHTEEIEEIMNQQHIAGYIGFDPTAPSLTIGNYIQVMILHFFQKAGHKPIILMGGATGRIGDPSGKDKERDLKSYEELDNNLDHQVRQFESLLNFKEGPNQAEMVNNLDFYRNMNVLDFLRDVGKSINISYMLAKDSVKNRLEKGLSFTEFSYQLLQAYDFQCLYQSKNCILQMGGSDQWGNITSGTEFIRRNLGAKAYAITTPLLTKTDGSKFGKSAEGNIWLDPELTTPYKFYQFWINADDDDLPKFFRYFSFKNKEEIENLEKEYADNKQQLKKILGEELTTRIHGKEAFDSVMTVSELLFNKKCNEDFLRKLTSKEWKTLAGEIPSTRVNSTSLENQLSIIDFLSEETGILNSKSDARRAVQGQAISINKNKVTDIETVINKSHLIGEKYMMVENGKKNKYLVEIQ